MKKIVFTIIISVLIAAILSVIFFMTNKDGSAVIAWGIMGFVYLGIQFLTGIILIIIKKTEIGAGLIIGAAVILLIGFPVCTML